MVAMFGVTETIAILFALYLIAAGAGIVLNGGFAGEVFDAIRKSSALTYLSGMAAFVIGGAIIAVHNDWRGGLAIIVSLLGWAALIEGMLLLAVPKTYLDFFAPLVRNAKLHAPLGWLSVTLGLLLLAAVFAV